VRRIFATAADWLETNRPFAMATLAALSGAQPAPLGTSIAVTLDGEIAGNIGAGCYEAAIVEAAIRCAKDGIARRLDLSLDGDELLGGTSCGSEMKVIVWRPDRSFATDARAIARGVRPVYLRIANFDYLIAPKEPLVIVGATTLAQELACIAGRMDFFTTVVDPRALFATRARLPDAEQIVHRWPEDALPGLLTARTALAVLSHDPKLDLPALRRALQSPAWYVGLLGSRNAQAARRNTLAREGFGAQALSRIRGPIGLDIGANGDAEIALAILAEMTALRRGRSGSALLATRGTIHDRG
jgi:xanthine dehydrogenase accessory factor